MERPSMPPMARLVGWALACDDIAVALGGARAWGFDRAMCLDTVAASRRCLAVADGT
jgi:hypothetical protein